MSEVFNMVGGGGSKNISSIIITGLESTDTITCTKDGKSYTATYDSTTKHWEIVGLPLGTFIVTATNGTKTKTETVLIDIAGVYEIEMSFILWLYRDGDEFEDTTGGWSGINRYTDYYGTTASHNGSYTKLSDRLKIYSSVDNTSSGFGTAKKIDVTNYTNLKIEVASVVVNHSTGNGFGMNAEKLFISSISSIIQAIGTNSLDISSYTGYYYITIGAWGYNYDLRVTKVWLE